MPIDLRRPLLAAVEAALQDLESEPPKSKKKDKKKKGGGSGRALLIGAGLMTAGRWAVRSHGRDMLDALQERLPLDGDRLDRHDGEPLDDEDFEDEDFDEPEGEADEDSDEEPEDEADEEPEERSRSKSRGRR